MSDPSDGPLTQRVVHGDEADEHQCDTDKLTKMGSYPTVIGCVFCKGGKMIPRVRTERMEHGPSHQNEGTHNR